MAYHKTEVTPVQLLQSCAKPLNSHLVSRHSNSFASLPVLLSAQLWAVAGREVVPHFRLGNGQFYSNLGLPLQCEIVM